MFVFEIFSNPVGIQRSKLAIGTTLSPWNYVFIRLFQNIIINVNLSVVLMLWYHGLTREMVCGFHHSIIITTSTSTLQFSSDSVASSCQCSLVWGLGGHLNILGVAEWEIAWNQQKMLFCYVLSSKVRIDVEISYKGGVREFWYDLILTQSSVVTL